MPSEGFWEAERSVGARGSAILAGDARRLQLRRLLNRAVGSLDRRLYLFEQLFPGVWLRNEPTEPLREHRPDLVLLRESAAQNHVHAGIDSLQFLENSIPVHYRQEEIQDDQADLIVDLLEDFQRFKTVPSDDHFITFLCQNGRGELRYFRFVVDDQN